MVKRTHDNMTMREHAEAWWIEQSKIVPPRDTPEYENMYQEWIDYAFMEFTLKLISSNTINKEN